MSPGVDHAKMWLAGLPPTARQRNAAQAVTALLFGVFAFITPFAGVQLTAVPVFVATFEATIFVTDLVTSLLLYALYSVYGNRVLLLLASGYLYSSLMIVMHGLTYPEVFSPEGLFGGHLQTTPWIYLFWHGGFAAVLVAYSFFKPDRVDAAPLSKGIARAVAITLAAFCVLAGLSVWGGELLPSLFAAGGRLTSLANLSVVPIILLCIVVIARLWSRDTVMNQWLVVAASATALEMMASGMLSSTRYTVGFYFARFFSFITSTVVLAALLAQATRLYAHLARANALLQREREARLMSLDAMSAALAHEIRQPVGAIVANASAAQRWIGRTPPELDEARANLKDIVSDGQRVGSAIQSVRDLFSKSRVDESEATGAVNANELIRETVTMTRAELDAASIGVRLELAADIPSLHAHSGQLQQVILNLINNAKDAMRETTGGPRLLTLRSERLPANAIALSVEDTGPGIEPKHLDRIFAPFFTTKRNGMGMGLAICRSIVEAHGGSLSAGAASPRGSVFRIVLPGS